MAEDLMFGKQNLNQLANPKKSATVAAAFDSDESDWSDDDGGENPPIVKQVIGGDISASLNVRRISRDEERKLPSKFSTLDKKEEHSHLNVDFSTTKTKVFDPSSSRRNSAFENEPYVSSPYFVKDSIKPGESDSQTNKKGEGTGTVTKEEKENKDEEEDDWDEESCNVNDKINTKIGKMPTSSNNNTAFFQPSSAGFVKQRGQASSKDKRKSSMVDWSETYSEGESEGGNAEVYTVENLPTDHNEGSLEQFESKFDELGQKTGVEEKPELNSVSHGNDHKQIGFHATAVSKVAVEQLSEEALPMEKAVFTTPSSAATISPTNAEFSGESLDYLDSSKDDAYDYAFEKQSLGNNPMPSSSSAAQLFQVGSTSPKSNKVPEESSNIIPSLNVPTSNPFLADTSKPKKKSKPSSAKHLLTRLFSSDNDKNINKSEVAAPPTRKTSEPIPLSTLLLNTPVRIPSSESESNIVDTDRYLHQHSSATTASTGTIPLIQSKYFPVDSSGGQEQLEQEGSKGPKKRKGFLGKMKKTLGFSSKGSKMRASESLIQLPVVATAAIIKDPCISTENIAYTSGESIVAVQTEGRPAEEILIDLLKEGKRYLEGRNYSKGAIGGGDADDSRVIEHKYGHRKSNNDNNEPMKKYSSDNMLTPFAGSSTMAKSEISLVDNNGDQGVAVAQGERVSKDRKMSSYYCSQAIENTPNRQVIYNLIEDFCCVLDKSFGEQDRLKSDNGNLFSEIDQVRGALECCEASKTELERQFQEMQDDFQKLQFCLEQECQARANLEGIVCELRAQMERQDEILNGELAEKADLLAALKQVETDNWNLKNQLSDFGVEREEFTKSYRGFEGTKNKCSELQHALTECCEKHDIMQREILDLRNENNEIKLKLDNCVFEKNQEINNILKNEVFGLKAENNEMKMKLDTCEFERNKLINEMESMKQGFSAEKAVLEGKICELLDGIAVLEKNKGEICKQTNTMLAAHHEEMDILKAEADGYRAKYEEEHKIREDLEHRLRTTASVAPSFRSPTHNDMERSPPSYASHSRTASPYQRLNLTSRSEPPSLSSSAIGGSRDTFKK